MLLFWRFITKLAKPIEPDMRCPYCHRWKSKSGKGFTKVSLDDHIRDKHKNASKYGLAEPYVYRPVVKVKKVREPEVLWPQITILDIDKENNDDTGNSTD